MEERSVEMHIVYMKYRCAQMGTHIRTQTLAEKTELALVLEKELELIKGMVVQSVMRWVMWRQM